MWNGTFNIVHFPRLPIQTDTETQNGRRRRRRTQPQPLPLGSTRYRLRWWRREPLIIISSFTFTSTTTDSPSLLSNPNHSVPIPNLEVKVFLASAHSRPRWRASICNAPPQKNPRWIGPYSGVHKESCRKSSSPRWSWFLYQSLALRSRFSQPSRFYILLIDFESVNCLISGFWLLRFFSRQRCGDKDDSELNQEWA